MTTARTEDIPTRVARYRTEFGIDAQVNDYGRIVVAVGEVGCVRLPAELGEVVADELTRQGLSTPIILDEASSSLRFLTQRPKASPLFDPLFLYQAKQCGYGAEISLPTPGYPGRDWRVEPTRPHRLASAIVVDIALEKAKAMKKFAVSAS